jgi:glycosyltransferase involved in cell wall biosynthesis
MTEKARREIILLYGHKNVVVAHGAFSNDLFSYTQKENKKEKWGIMDKTMIFSMCRLVAKKRVDLIIESFQIYHKKNPSSVLFIGGNGPERAKLEKLAADLGIQNAVTFLGYVDDRELLDYYSSSDIFVTADNADYDITTFVALALGKRVVASAQHEFEPHLNELNQLFHATPTPAGFAQSYEDSLSQKTKVSVSRAKELLFDYSWEHYFQKIKLEIDKSL